LAGLRESLIESGLKFDPQLVDGDNFTEQSGYESALRLLTKSPNITALFAFSTPNALGAWRAANELGWMVPEQLSIVTFDDSPFADFMSVPLSTICQDVEKLGSQAAAIVLRSLHASDNSSRKHRDRCQYQIPIRLIKRSSIRKRIES
jgi:LacI family transcriptional regulator